MGYKVELIAPSATTRPAAKPERVEARVPDDAPKFFRDAFEAAREKKRPIVIDFWATWCAPCKQLKKETLENAGVSKALADVQFIYVDVDKYPGLAKAYQVRSVPDVFLVDRERVVVDRLKNFEPPEPFLKRLRRVLEE